MKLKYSIKTAFKGLKSNKIRSFLTILGIVIGVSAIILIMSIGKGAENIILDQIRGLGSQTIIIEPGKEPQGPSSFTEIFTDSLKDKDVADLKNPSKVQGLKILAPNVMRVMPVSFKDETVRVNILGSSPDISEILEIYPEKGIFISEDDVKNKANTAVIGYEMKEKLFHGEDALNKKIKIKDRTFKVIGVIPKKGQIALFNADEIILVPYTVAQDYLMGIDHFNSIIVKAEDNIPVKRVVRDIEFTLREGHNILDPSKDDFHVMTQEDAVERLGIITTIFTALLSSVAAVSLIVGGIGIMNIMLVSVTERTKEIGLRKALGATEKNILIQFLLESVFLTIIGGIIGIIIGSIFSFISSLILSRVLSVSWKFVFPVSSAVIGILVSFIIGLIFGIYPARKASLKSPIEALRYE